MSVYSTVNMTLLNPRGTPAHISLVQTDSFVHLTHFLLNQASLVTFNSTLLFTLDGHGKLADVRRSSRGRLIHRTRGTLRSPRPPLATRMTSSDPLSTHMRMQLTPCSLDSCDPKRPPTLPTCNQLCPGHCSNPPPPAQETVCNRNISL